ncbi:four helix bundle protein [Candidatus Uhrbacteria bacterium]|nr:four helix bundle protein [Candidatus Uhrbacteria bacterium]
MVFTPIPETNSSSDLPILKKLSDVYKLWHGYLQQLPRLSRYTLGAKIDALAAETVELALLAGYASRVQKLPIVQKASTKLDTLKLFLRIAWELKLIDHKKYAALTVPLAEAGKMLGGWLKQLAKEAT